MKNSPLDNDVKSPYRKRATLDEEYGLVGINAMILDCGAVSL